MGASPVAITVLADIPVALQQGIVDGMGWTIGNLEPYGMATYVKYALEQPNVGAQSTFLAVNKAFYAQLPADLQSVVDNAIKRLNSVMGPIEDKHTDEGRKTLAAKYGIEFYTPPKEELARFNALLSQVREKWVTQVSAKGVPAREILDAYYSELEKRGVNVK